MVLNALQLANSVGNAGFNEIMEANLSAEIPKPNPTSDMWAIEKFHWKFFKIRFLISSLVFTS